MTKRKPIKISSRKAKGRELQKWVCKQISFITGLPWGKDEYIAPREMGQTGCDVRLVGIARTKFPFSVECKAQEKWNIMGWIKQTKANQKEGTEWLLFTKKKMEKPVVIMDAELFFKIAKDHLKL